MANLKLGKNVIKTTTTATILLPSIVCTDQYRNKSCQNVDLKTPCFKLRQGFDASQQPSLYQDC